MNGRAEIGVLPAHIQRHLGELAARLSEALGETFIGLLVHGSVARGEYRPDESGVDTVIVLSDASVTTLEAIGEPLQRARYAARIEAVIVLEEEIAGASDVFPLFYDEIRRCHILIAGRDAFDGVRVQDRHRRLRIEQELREAQFRLRRAVTDALGAPEAIGGAVYRRVRQSRNPLLALLALKGIDSAPDLRSVLTTAGTTYGIDTSLLLEPREHPTEAHAAFVALLTRAIDDVNRLPEG